MLNSFLVFVAYPEIRLWFQSIEYVRYCNTGMCTLLGGRTYYRDNATAHDWHHEALVCLTRVTGTRWRHGETKGGKRCD